MDKQKHTEHSLKYYFGKGVYFYEEEHYESEKGRVVINKGGGTLVNISSVGDDRVSCEKVFMGVEYREETHLKCIQVNPSDIYPILKTADELSDNDCAYIYDRTYHKIDGFYHEGYNDVLEPSEIHKLLELGYGAIPDSKSPTGYFDLFGMPCVTPKMFEEGVLLNE